MSHGRFVWYELITQDLEKSRAFYTELFGWTLEPWGDQGYNMIKLGEAPIGGMMASSPEQKIPTCWGAYVTVPDVDATATQVEKLGGKVIHPPTDIPEVGRFCVIGDRQGAAVYPFKFAGEEMPEPDGPRPPGHFCWHELLTSDADDALKFYGELFGWGVSKMEQGGMEYHMFMRGEKMEAGAMQMPPDAQAPPHWLLYVMVDDVDESTSRARSLGATVFVEPQDIPGIGRFSVAADSLGAPFAMFRQAIKA